MPQALVAIGHWVTGVLFSAGVSAATAVAIGQAVITILNYATVATLLAKATEFLTPKQRAQQISSGLEVAITDSGAQGFAIYGSVRCNGINKIPAITGGNDGQYLEQVLEFCMHEVDSYGDVQADDVVIPTDDITAVTGDSLNDGRVTSGRFDDRMFVRRYRGTATQTADAALVANYPNIFTSDFRGRGRAFAAITYDWGDGKTYNGVPNMVFVVNGKKCYDPRLDSSPGADPTDDTYKRFTVNPALQWADYLISDVGGRVPAANINWSSVVAAANVCDGIVNVPGSFSTFETGGNASISSRTITKTGATDGSWDASVRSTDSITHGQVSAVINDTTKSAAFGIATDPATDNNYTSIDYCFMWDADSDEVTIYENGVSKGTFGSFNDKTVLLIDYDGSYIRYYVDGKHVRTSAVATPGTAYYFDSSLKNTNASFTIDVQHRYTFSGRIGLAVPWQENARFFVDAMLGRMTRRDGIWYIYAGSWEAASYSITQKDWLQIESIKTVAPRDSGRWNAVRCWYTDRRRNWQREECFPRRNSAYKSADAGEEITLEIEQPGCTDEYEAQRKAEFVLRQSRNQIALSGILPPRFRKVATGEVVAITFEELGWQSKLMRIRAMDLFSNGSVRVALAEEQEADWNDLTAAEYNAPSVSTIPATNPTKPSAPSSLAITENVNGTLSFKIGAPVVIPIGTRYQIIRAVQSLATPTNTVIWEGDVLNVDLIAPNSRHWYFARAYVASLFSAYQPNTFGTGALPADVIWTTFVNCIGESTIA